MVFGLLAKAGCLDNLFNFFLNLKRSPTTKWQLFVKEGLEHIFQKTVPKQL